MTAQEWAAFALELEHTFRGTFGPAGPDDADGSAQEAAMRRHVAGEDYDVASAALALLVEDGQVFMPTAAEVRAAVRRVTTRSRAPFAEVLRVFGRSYSRHRRALDAGRITRLELEREVVRDVVADCGEGAGRWIVARTAQALALEPVEGEHAGAVRHRLEGEYSTFAERAEEDQRVGLALERAGRPELGRGRGPRQLNPAATLGLPERS